MRIPRDSTPRRCMIPKSSVCASIPCGPRVDLYGLQVGYCGVGTVAYVYKNGSFFMLGLAPCLHEDFPLVEAVTGVNLVAAQLHIAMDVPLQARALDQTRPFAAANETPRANS